MIKIINKSILDKMLRTHIFLHLHGFQDSFLSIQLEKLDNYNFTLHLNISEGTVVHETTVLLTGNLDTSYLQITEDVLNAIAEYENGLTLNTLAAKLTTIFKEQLETNVSDDSTDVSFYLYQLNPRNFMVFLDHDAVDEQCTGVKDE